MTRPNGIRRLLNHGERGQAIWWMLLIVPLFVIGAAIVIDASVWYGHRRVYQKTADASALAGAQELFRRTDSGDMTARAEDKAEDWMTRNNAPPAEFANDTPEVVDDCWGVTSFDGKPDGVIVDVSKEAPLLFMRAFDVAPFDIGAHARVCVGSPQDEKGMLPFGIPADTTPCFDEGAPLFGAQCDIAIRVPEGESGEAQYLKLHHSPGDDPKEWSRRCSDASVPELNNKEFVKQVAEGAHTWCMVAGPDETCPYDPGPDDTGHCVYSDTGNRAKWALQGLQCRVLGSDVWPKNCPPGLLGEGACDAAFGPGFDTNDGIDQWWEMLYVEALGEGEDPRGITPDETVTFVPRDCYGPRLVTVIVIDQYEAQGNPPYPIRGFAGFVIEGCRDGDDAFNPWCLLQNQEGDYPGRGPYLSNTGHLWMEGMFINYVDIGGQGGPATKYGRMQLYLIE